MGHNEHFPYAYHSSSPQSASSPASSPPSISPSGSSSPLVPSSPSSSTSSPKLVATFKLPKTCTACGKAIKTQGKVCAKCKMRKYRERKKEQEQSLKVQMKAYRDQEEALKARIRLLEEDLQRRASLDRSSPFAPMSESASKMSEPSERASARHEKLLAQQQEALKQQQEIIAAQQTVIAQQQHIINQHNLGHLLPTSSSSVPSSRLHPLLDHNSAAAVAALTSLAEDVKPPSRTSSSAFHLPSLLHSALPSMQYSQRSSSLPTRSAPVLPSPAELSAEQRRGPAPAVAASNNRMAITHLLSPSSAEMCPVSCI